MVESTIALALVFAVLVGLLASLTAGIRGVVTGRQRGAALALANEVLEQARGRSYAEVGHDLDSDPTLAGDPMLSGAAPALTYSGVSPAEPLAASTVDAGAAGGTMGNPLFPFSPHRWSSAREGTTYTTTVYVSQVAPASGDPYKRMTVSVSWSPAQYATAARTVTLSSFLFDVTPPPDPRLVGEAEADSGSFTVTGSLAGVALSEARIALPYATGTVDSGFIRTTKGFAATAHSSVVLVSGVLTGCVVDGPRADCPGSKAPTDADNDSGTAPPDTDRAGPDTDAGGVIAAGSALSTTLAGGDAEALATARSCWACSGPGPDDDDRLPYQWGRASGPASLSMGFRAGSAEGLLLSAPTGCTTDCAAVAVDRDDVAGSARLTSTASAVYPALDLVTFPSGAPAGYAGMVRIGTAGVAASAGSGPGAAAPGAGGAPVMIQLYDTTLLPGYKTVTVIPGSTSPLLDPTAHAEIGVNGAQVTMDTTVHWNPAVTSQAAAAGAVIEAQAGLTNWLFVEVHLVVKQGSNIEADLVLHLDYGRLAARASYEAA